MRKRYRELGGTIGVLPVGKKNCLTDVPGVRVGNETLYYSLDGDDAACTGVTAILPHEGNIFKEKVIASSVVFNGFGKTAGLVQLQELGLLESPIMLTNTFGVPAVLEGTLHYLCESNKDIGDGTGTVNVVVGECNDSYLNAIRKFSVTPHHAYKAITRASTRKVEEGAVGAGTGMVCFDYKGGIGTSSRVIVDKDSGKNYIVGCLVLSNFGKRNELTRYKQYLDYHGASDLHRNSDGSIMMVLATNAPLNERQLNRIAKRCGVGLGRTGSHMAHGSGDIAIAFSTAQTIPHYQESTSMHISQLREDTDVMDQLFIAATETTEEAILNSLTMAKTMTGRKGRKVEGIPYL